jgi:zinc D-Ala-D-Ala carboxypeptidase
VNYFSDAEQCCPCCGEKKFANGFLDDMNGLREEAGHPLKANSMCRCAKHNKAEGGASGSYHLITHSFGCCAADISTIGWDAAKKWRFVKIAMSRGFSVGIAKTFLHVDQRHKYAGQEPVLYSY